MRKEIILLLAFFQIVFLLITFMISIFVSHRIAGPLYKLKNFLRQNGGGKLSPDLYFRKNDHFMDVAEEYNLMLSKLRGEFRGVREGLATAANDLDGQLSSISAGEKPDPEQIKRVVALLHEASEKVPH